MPDLSPDEYEALKQDIEARGVLVPVEYDENGNILDGHHRVRACEELGIDDWPKITRTGMDEAAKRIHARQLNLSRRHLNQQQRRELIREQLKDTPEKSDRQIAAGLGVSQTTVGTQRKDMEASGQLSKLDSSIGADGKERPRQVKPKTAAIHLPGDDGISAMGQAGKAAREMLNQENQRRNESLKAQVNPTPSGQYDVIVIDPPWPMQKIQRDVRPNQAGFDYPTMSEQEICALELPCADNCHVWVWATQKYLPVAFRCLDAWALKYVCTFVWHKPGGVQPYGLPQYNAEFALYARRGAPKFIDTKAFSTAFSAPRRAHSEKPEEFYRVLRRVTSGKRLDMFNRRKIDGFKGWGNESVAA